MNSPMMMALLLSAMKKTSASKAAATAAALSGGTAGGAATALALGSALGNSKKKSSLPRISAAQRSGASKVGGEPALSRLQAVAPAGVAGPSHRHAAPASGGPPDCSAEDVRVLIRRVRESVERIDECDRRQEEDRKLLDAVRGALEGIAEDQEQQETDEHFAGLVRALAGALNQDEVKTDVASFLCALKPCPDAPGGPSSGDEERE